MANKNHVKDKTEKIAGRRQVDEAQELSGSLYRSFFDNAPVGIVITDSESYYLDANASACGMLGYTHDELVGLHASNIVTLVEAGPALRNATEKRLTSHEWQFRRKDGSTFTAEVMTTLMPDGKLVGMIHDVTERKLAEEYLSRLSRNITERRKAIMVANRLAAIVESSEDAIIGKDLNGIVTSWNHGAEKIFGYTADEMIGTSTARLIPAERKAEEEQLLARLQRGEKLEHFETLRQAKDGRMIEVSITTSPIKDADGTIVGASKIVRDIKVLKDHEREIDRKTQLYAAHSQCNQAIAHCADEAELLPVICRDAVQFGGMKMAWIGMYDDTSRSILPVSSFGEGAEMLEGMRIPAGAGKSASEPIAKAYSSGRAMWSRDFLHDETTAVWHERAAKYGFKASASLPLNRAGVTVGVLNLYSDNVNAFEEEAQKLLLEMSMDVSFALNRFHNEAERKKEQSQLFYLSNYDSLTGLPNRAQLADHFKYALSLAKRSNGRMAVLFVDVDHFKNINDTLGYSIGDALLIEVSKRIQSVLREEDTATRLGGDEFILTLPGCDSNGAVQVAQKLLAVISKPYQIAQYRLLVTASVGIALYPDDGSDLETLSKCADTAMYRVKQEGRNGYRLFTTEMQARMTHNMQLIDGMRQALAQNQFRLHYQPQISMHDGRIVGFEALLRWKHPELGDISPTEFIPVAEDSGLILPIGEWVLRGAVSQLKRWRDSGHANMVMAVNLSAVQFRHPGLTDMVNGILKKMQLPPEYLELELTESAMMQDPQEAISVMNHLHDCGIRMSLDHFGTGYSSLNYLKKFRLNKIKIDQSFVHELGTNADDMAIVAAIISMSRNLGLQTIAEGVETTGQMEYLRNNGCNEAQGFHFSEPVAAKQLEEYLIAHNA